MAAACAEAPPPLPELGPELPIARLAGIGEAHLPRLERLGITTVGELLRHLPRRYEDTRQVLPLGRLEPGEVQTTRARVRSLSVRPSHGRRRMTLLEAVLEDGADTARAVWFNQPFLARQLEAGTELLLSGPVEVGRLGLSLRNPSFERVRSDRADQRHLGRLAPVYPETEKLSSRYLRSRIEPLLHLAEAMEDPLPPSVRERERLLPLAAAIRQIHFPVDLAEADRARERIAFEEMFLLHLAAQRARRRRLVGAGIRVPYDVGVARTFTVGLPFRLTDGQRVAAHEILTDMAGPGPMNRLLQGDVGSGKTVVAAMAALMAHSAGYQTAVMAPTELLARQHHQTLDRLLAPLGLPPRLLVGSSSAAARREVLAGLRDGHDSLVVGTHALIEEEVVMNGLGLAVVDEQHRFGVAQRQRLRQKSGAMPNFLALTATPIPRSLALTLYGDVNLSELRQLPPGRLPVATSIVPATGRAGAYGFVREQVRAGRQAFIVCPLIEESERLSARSAVAEHRRLSDEVFSDLSVDLLHGRQPAPQRERTMARFAAGETDILVTTSVIEVGVDVPNATVMLIEGAERFGLAQLHQFRGRVGRGAHASHCLLVEGGLDEDGSERLRAVAGSDSGFELAELDLRLRGPGDVVGLRQHGLPEVRTADLLDIAFAERTRQAAENWLDQDPDLVAHPPLQRAMDRYRAVFDLD